MNNNPNMNNPNPGGRPSPAQQQQPNRPHQQPGQPNQQNRQADRVKPSDAGKPAGQDAERDPNVRPKTNVPDYGDRPNQRPVVEGDQHRGNTTDTRDEANEGQDLPFTKQGNAGE